SVVPAGTRHKGVDYRFEAAVSYCKVAPGFNGKVCSVHVYMKAAAVVHLHIAIIEHPAYFLKFLQSGFPFKYRAYQLESIVSSKTAVCNQLPMVAGVMVVTFHCNCNSGLTKFTGKNSLF